MEECDVGNLVYAHVACLPAGIQFNATVLAPLLRITHAKGILSSISFLCKQKQPAILEPKPCFVDFNVNLNKFYSSNEIIDSAWVLLNYICVL